VAHKGAARFLAETWHHVNHAGWQAGALNMLGHPQGGQW
jgi:hypothetical protein